MKIIIEYESSWRNSFLDGTNNEELPKKGRKFIGSITKLKKDGNYIKREVTIDTVMGILNRLIGDQRKLYQAREQENYFFADLEQKNLISFVDKQKVINNEITFIRNITGSTDQNSFTGAIKMDDPTLQSDYSAEFWGVLALDLPQLCDFITSKTPIKQTIKLNPLSICEKIEQIGKIKPVKNEGAINQAYEVLAIKYEDYKGLNPKGLVKPITLYCSALYLQLELLSKKYDMTTACSNKGCIKGISKNGFTKKDFMKKFTTGEQKKIWGNPYIYEEYIKGTGKIKHLMKKTCGTLEINIDVKQEEANILKKMITNAGVSSFYLGKKGLAYVSKISTREVF